MTESDRISSTAVSSVGSIATTAREQLAGASLLAVSGDDLLVPGLLSTLEQLGMGVVITGATDLGLVDRLRRQLPTLAVAAESSSATQHVATEAHPFLLPAPDLFRAGSLSDVLDEQREAGASFAITPTGHIPVGESAALKAVMAAANALDRDDMVVHLPVAADWLRQDPARQLAAVTARIRHPVLLSLAHPGDPCSVAGLSSSLRQLAKQSHVILHRTDLAGVDFLARGGLAATFGHRASLRHGASKGFSPTPADRSPRVLLPGFLQFMKSTEIARTWGNAEPPNCSCPEDDGRSLDRYTGSTADVHQAHRHNVHVLHRIVRRVLDDSGSREGAWKSLLLEAQFAHEQASEELRMEFKLPRPVVDWMKP